MMLGGTIESFSEEMDKFIYSTADELGDFIGSACDNPDIVFDRFGDRLAAAISRRIELSNVRGEGRPTEGREPRSVASGPSPRPKC